MRRVKANSENGPGTGSRISTDATVEKMFAFERGGDNDEAGS